MPLERDAELPGPDAGRAKSSSAVTCAAPPAPAARSATTSGSVGSRGRGERHGELGDHAPRPRREHDDAVGQHHRLLDVVGDEQHRPRLARQRAGQPRLHVGARDRVERGERLVEAQHRRAGQQRAQERHALAHAARQLVGPRVLEALEAELGEAPAPRARAPRAATRRSPAARAPRCPARSPTAAAGRAGA